MEEASLEILKQLKEELPDICAYLRLNLPLFALGDEYLEEIYKKYDRQMNTWAQRNQSKTNGYENFKNHFIDLIVWELFTTETDSESQRELLGLVWERLKKPIEFKASRFKNVGVRSSESDNLDDMMQEAFLRFEKRIRKFDPNNSKTATLKSYVSMVYQKLFINIANLRAVKGFDEDVLPDSPHDDEKAAEAILNIDDRDAIEVAINSMKQERPQDAKKFEALKMKLFDGKTNQDVAAELGESESWTSKAVKAMTEKLTNHFSE